MLKQNSRIPIVLYDLSPMPVETWASVLQAELKWVWVQRAEGDLWAVAKSVAKSVEM